MTIDMFVGQSEVDFFLTGRNGVWVPLPVAIEQVDDFYLLYKEIWLSEGRTRLESGEYYSVAPKKRHLLGAGELLIDIFGPWYCSPRTTGTLRLSSWIDSTTQILLGEPLSRIWAWEESKMIVRNVNNVLVFEDRGADGFIQYPERKVWVEDFVPQLLLVGRQVSEFTSEILQALENDEEMREHERDIAEAERLGYLLRRNMSAVGEYTEGLEAAFAGRQEEGG